MRKLITLIVVMVTVLALAGVAQGRSKQFNESDFKAELSGDAEVPPVETDTSGEAKFNVHDGMIDFELEIEDADEIFGAAGAHIHCAPAGQNGPVVVFLAGQVPGGFDGTIEVKATVTDANIVDPTCGATIAELVDSMRDGNTYVNVHSPDHPGGEVRGQIEQD